VKGPAGPPTASGLAEVRALEDAIGELWGRREQLDDRDGAAREVVLSVMNLLDTGRLRVAEIDRRGDVRVHTWLKQAIVMLFRLCPIELSEAGPMLFADRLPAKRRNPGVRVVPGAYARYGSYIAEGAVLMPSFVNVGAYIGTDTLIDTWATVGSCAQVGERVHISGGVGVGGVLEPVQANPVIVESDAFIGSRCMLIEGVRVGRGAVLGAGLVLSPTIPVIDTLSSVELRPGVIPPWSVVVSGTRSRRFPSGEFGLPCALVIKRLAQGERLDKVRLNELVRSHGAAL
jgi:2,3,4,5-tetrahydropyridine-2-carboxylate N-succinyltransferase